MTTGGLAKGHARRLASEILKTAAGDDIVITNATGARMVAAWTLVPAPRIPSSTWRRRTRRPGNTWLGSRHTIPAAEVDLRHDRRAVRPAHRRRGRADHRPAGAGRYTYTPRKVLRRVLDHALDHLNRIDQWLEWRRDGVVPDADRRLGTVDGDAARRPARAGTEPRPRRRGSGASTRPRGSCVQRAAGLTREELDWPPPTGAGRSPRPSPRGALGDALRGVAGRGAAVGRSADAVRGGLLPAQ